MLIARERPERLGFAAVMNPQKYADTARLCQLQQFDQRRTPVIFVHGLQETAASWTPMINSLRDDARIREHYQFWVYSYPSGYPYPYSAALLRRDLDGIKRAFPNHKRVVLIGHSMGGMICRLMITDAGDKIWRDFFGTSPAKTPLESDGRKLLEESLVFNHRPDVQRAIFISTPHRGSTFASGWIGRIGSGLVRTPQLFTPIYQEMKPLLVDDPTAATFKRMPNSVDTLEPNDRVVLAVNKLPITPGIPYHSIMGDRGRGDTPNSSDGIVPYWSSHLEGAKSELIVNSDHGAQYNPQAIAEVRRILRVNLGEGENLELARNAHRSSRIKRAVSRPATITEGRDGPCDQRPNCHRIAVHGFRNNLQLLLSLVGGCLRQRYRKLAVLDQPHANSVISNSRSHAQETSNFLKRRPPKA